MDALGLQNYTVSMCGGALLMIVSHNMIFPHHEADVLDKEIRSDPVLVPIATPLLTGGGLLTAILLYPQRVGSTAKVGIALLISFAVVTVVMVLAPALNRILGKRGLYALEQLMGMILSMLAIEMLVNGTRLFLQTHGAA
jgi:multiple antibiotic resistance protein